MAELPAAATQLDFLNKLQRILHEGLFVATYKFALVLALAELAVEKTPAADGTLAIPLGELSDRFITLYWHQTAPFVGGVVLAQNTGRQAAAVTLIAEFRAHAPTLAVARRHPRWHRLVARIGRLLDEMPLWRLQLVGADRLDFLYEEKLIDGAIVLRPGVAAFFKVQFGVVQALVQMGWLSFVQSLPTNRDVLGATGDLADFLFGTNRAALRSIMDGLRDLQRNRCFYCDRTLADAIEVDHFIPWSRYPRDLGHNFVLADRTCNQHKAEMLAATGHLERWLDRNRRDDAQLGEAFAQAPFVLDADASFSVAEWAYEQAERARSLVWVRARETTHLSATWRQLF
ncbi:MAG TPA: HNH endonuclease [Burkholderiales bacterium]|nr:HNH endonuclease [Burkholderiales bacterium]